MNIRTLEEAERYLEGLINLERRSDWPYRRLGLEPIRGLLARVGQPDRGLRIIHIAGSKGKGSTALLLEALLGAAGGRVGTFSSPHLVSFAERFRVGGREVEGYALAGVIRALRPHIEDLRASQPENAPTFFDALCAAGLRLFADLGVDWCILEVGLGGRLDSTNAVTPVQCCITSIELEHTEVLGDTLAEIAGEKAGILKPGVPLVLGEVPPEAAEVILSRAAALDVPVVRAGLDFSSTLEEVGPAGVRARLVVEGESISFALPMAGAHHAKNAATALAVARAVLKLRPDELGELASRAFPPVSLPGRAEALSRSPLVVVDAAHTEASAHALAETLGAFGAGTGGVHFVLSVSQGKDLDAILQAWLPLASRFTLTRALASRSLDPEALASAIRRREPGVELRIVGDPERALGDARHELRAGEALCATGSFFLAGIARSVLAETESAADATGP